MISTSDFLAMMKAISAPAETGARVRLGTVDPSYVGGNPKVTFDGEGALSGRGYAYLDSYLPWPGDRVALIEVGSTWLIVGSIDSPTAGFPVQRIGSTVNTTATSGFAAATETVTDTLTVPLETGKLYELLWTGNYSNTTADATLLWRIREDSLSGTQIGSGRTIWNSTNTVSASVLRTYYTAVADGNKTFVVSGSGSAGTTIRTGAANGPSIFSCTLIG
jgi:hypothetical protein